MKAKIIEILPDFSEKITNAFRNLKRTELSDQFTTLELDYWTYDAEVQAIYIYLCGHRPLNIAEKNIIRIIHDECIEFSELDGIVVADIDNLGRISGIEVINRPDITEQLSQVQSPIRY